MPSKQTKPLDQQQLAITLGTLTTETRNTPVRAGTTALSPWFSQSNPAAPHFLLGQTNTFLDVPRLASSFLRLLYWNVPMLRAELTEAADTLLVRSTDAEVGSASDVSPVTELIHIFDMDVCRTTKVVEVRVRSVEPFLPCVGSLLIGLGQRSNRKRYRYVFQNHTVSANEIVGRMRGHAFLFKVGGKHEATGRHLPKIPTKSIDAIRLQTSTRRNSMGHKEAAKVLSRSIFTCIGWHSFPTGLALEYPQQSPLFSYPYSSVWTSSLIDPSHQKS